MKQVYPQGTSDTRENNYAAASNIYRDPVYETSANFRNGLSSWYYESLIFPYSTSPFFVRSAGCDYGSLEGAFYLSSTNGRTGTYIGFRPVLVVL